MPNKLAELRLTQMTCLYILLMCVHIMFYSGITRLSVFVHEAISRQEPEHFRYDAAGDSMLSNYFSALPERQAQWHFNTAGRRQMAYRSNIYQCENNYIDGRLGHKSAISLRVSSLQLL